MEQQTPSRKKTERILKLAGPIASATKYQVFVEDLVQRASKASLMRVILSFDSDYFHHTCDALGFPTSWQSFQNELLSYNREDLVIFYKELLVIDLEEFKKG